MPFFLKAFSLSLKEYPIINSTYDPAYPFERVEIHNHNISVAVDSP